MLSIWSHSLEAIWPKFLNSRDPHYTRARGEIESQMYRNACYLGLCINMSHTLRHTWCIQRRTRFPSVGEFLYEVKLHEKSWTSNSTRRTSWRVPTLMESPFIRKWSVTLEEPEVWRNLSLINFSEEASRNFQLWENIQKNIQSDVTLSLRPPASDHRVSMSSLLRWRQLRLILNPRMNQEQHNPLCLDRCWRQSFWTVHVDCCWFVF